MKHLIFTLKMPHRGSWNNKWSGDDEVHRLSYSFTNDEFKKLPDIVGKYHEYRWNDGWTAVVEVEVVNTVKERKEKMRHTCGFFGYGWMVKSLLQDGYIHTIR